MPLDCRVLPQHRLALAIARDSVSGPDILDAMYGVFEHADWKPGFDVLWDGRGIRALVLAPEDIEAVVAATADLRDLMGTGKSAVVTSRLSDYGPARLLQVRNESVAVRDIRLFTSMAEAVVWLDIPDDLVGSGQRLSPLGQRTSGA
jgi:hypothetical protein